MGGLRVKTGLRAPARGLVQVLRFEQVRTGMRVVLRPCGICGLEHAGTVTERSVLRNGVDAIGGTHCWPEAWQVLPPLPCHPGKPWAIVPEMVSLGMVYEPELN